MLKFFKVELTFLDQSSANNFKTGFYVILSLFGILIPTIVKKVGTVPRDNLGGMMVVNTRMELCGAFINRCLSHNSMSWCCTFIMYYSPLRMNVTYVNYTVKGAAKDEKKVR